jgi:hypothetical protein
MNGALSRLELFFKFPDSGRAAAVLP